MQALYAHFSSENETIDAGEQNLMKSMDQIYDLYLYQLAFANEILHAAYKERSDAASKHFPTEDDLKKETNFTLNRALKAIVNSDSIQKILTQKKISWSDQADHVTKVFRKIRNTDEYKKYFRLPQTSIEDDIDFLLFVYKNYVFDDEFIEGHYEDLNIHWNDDIFVVNPAVSKTIKSIREDEPIILPELFKDKEDDARFAKLLFRKTIMHSDDYLEIIKNKAQNWEIDRIAMMDIIIMKMGIAELIHFENIPIKVTLNEYIELAKSFSTPKSSVFINGILDKLVIEFKANGKLVKSGRGLQE